MSESPAERGTNIRMRSASWLFAGQILSLAASFPTSVLVARGLGASGKGALSVTQMIATFCAVLFNFGIGQAFTYHAARREAHGRDAVVLSLGVAAGVSATLGLLWIPLGSWLAHALNVEPVFVLAGLLATGPALAAQYLNAYIVGGGSIRDASLVNAGSLVLQLCCYIAALLTGNLNVGVAIGIWAGAITLSSTVFVFMAWRREAPDTVEAGGFVLLRRMLPYGVAAWPAGILGTAAQRFDVFLLAHYAGTAAVGVYSIAVTFAELCWYAPSALNGVLIPKVAAEEQGGLDVTLRVGRVLWVLTAFIALGVFICAAPLIPLIFGAEFKASVLPLALILPGIVAGSLSSSAGSYLAGIGRPIDTTRAAAVNVAVNVTANIILAPRFGAAGAAISSTLSYIAAAIVIVALFLRETGASPRDLLIPRVSDVQGLYAGARRALRRES